MSSFNRFFFRKGFNISLPLSYCFPLLTFQLSDTGLHRAAGHRTGVWVGGRTDDAIHRQPGGNAPESRETSGKGTETYAEALLRGQEKQTGLPDPVSSLAGNLAAGYIHIETEPVVL